MGSAAGQKHKRHTKRHVTRARKLWRLLGTGISLVLFAGAVWVFFREVSKFGVHRILEELGHYSPGTLALAGGLTFVCYWVLTLYDWVGFRYVRYRIRYRRVTLGAFVAYAFANNIGLANFAGAAVRYRFYSRWKIEPAIIGKVVALDVLSNWLGFLLTAGLVFVIDPPAIPVQSRLPIADARPLGFILLAPVALYLILSFLRRKPFTIGAVRLPLLRSPLFIAQVLVGCFDFALGGVVLYALLPGHAHLSYQSFMGIYLLAQTAGIISHVPGGLGIFESVIFFSLTPRIASPTVIGALLVYRVVYFLVPFALAALIFALFELSARKTASDSPTG